MFTHTHTHTGYYQVARKEIAHRNLLNLTTSHILITPLLQEFHHATTQMLEYYTPPHFINTDLHATDGARF